MNRGYLIPAIAVLGLMFAAPGLAAVGADKTHAGAGHNEEGGVAREAAVERVGWMSLSCLLFLLSGKIDSFVTAWWSGASGLIKWRGQLINTDQLCFVHIPDRIRREFVLVMGVSGYVCRIDFFSKGTGNGILLCATDTTNEVGTWSWEPWSEDHNLPCLTVKLKTGAVHVIPLMRVI